MSATPLERGLVLFELGHFARAEKEFLASLQDAPDNALAYTMLAMCMINTKKRREALEFAKQALELDPELSYAHYVLAYCYARSSIQRLSMPAITEALRLDPEASDYWAVKAYLHLCAASKFRISEAKQALECAEQGLSCDPHSAQCMQLRARALLALNRKGEAFGALKSALAIDPNDADSHELRAWMAFEGGQSVEAREFYAEALRLNPSSATARTGLLSAMRAKHLIYRFVLKFMSPDGVVKPLPLIIIGGAPFVVAYLHKIPNPICEALSLALILPVTGFTLFALFGLFLANPIFNLCLWLDADTRWSLSRDEILAAKLLAINLSIVILIVGLVVGSSVLWYLPLAMFGLLLAPTVIVFNIPAGRVRKILYVCLAIDFGSAMAASALLFSLDILEVFFKNRMDLIFRFWATTMSASIGLSISAFWFETAYSRIHTIVDKFEKLKTLNPK